jgi:hypothetical protein
VNSSLDRANISGGVRTYKLHENEVILEIGGEISVRYQSETLRLIAGELDIIRSVTRHDVMNDPSHSIRES